VHQATWGIQVEGVFACWAKNEVLFGA